MRALEDGTLEETEETRKKRKRKKKDKEIDFVTEEPTPPPLKKKKRVKGKGVGKSPVLIGLILAVTIATQGNSKSTRMMIKLWELMVSYKNSDGRRISEIFITLPTRKELPQYYQIIKKPIDLKKIKVN